MKTEYWTMWGEWPAVCSKHKTASAAERAAKACEKRGGAPHLIIEVRRVKRR